MKRVYIVCWFIIIAVAVPSYAGDVQDSDVIKILVTFSDPGMSNATRAGPARPGYSRRSSTYLVSVGVKRAAKRIAQDFELLTLDEWPIVPLKVHCLLFAVAAGVPVDELLARLRARPEVESAQLLNEFEVSGTAAVGNRDPYSKLQHNLDTLEVAKAHSWSVGDGTNVTIIDTGADFNHPELLTQIESHRDFVDHDKSDFSADAHGTAVAGVIGAAANNGVGVIGVAPSTRLSVLKACWYAQDRSRAVCNSFTLAKALSHAVGSGPDVINLSLGGPSDALLERLVAEALKRGIVVVAAAPAQRQAGFPANIDEVIVVGSDVRLDSEETGLRFPINAPGDDILVPVPRGGYDYASGSSLSAAHVSGIVALLVASRPDLSRDEINTLLVDSPPAIGDSVNACRALARLLQRSGCRNHRAISQSL